MNPPFDPPYVTTVETDAGVRRIETLADGTTREVSEPAVSSKIKALRASTHVATTAKVPKQPDNDKATVFLKVSFAEKDEAKKLGAKWDAARKQWYVPVGKDVNLFAKWWPDMLKDVLM